MGSRARRRRRPRGGPLRPAALTLLAGLAIIAGGAVADAAEDLSEPAAAQLPSGIAVLRLGGPLGAPPLAPGFVGLSLEYYAVLPYTGANPTALNPLFERLVAGLAPGQAPVLRIGGDSTDRTWVPVRGRTEPAGIRLSLTPRWISVTRTLARQLGARLILGVNLEADRPWLASAEARAFISGIGRSHVEAIELGNEPELYGTFPWYQRADGQPVRGRASSYQLSGYLRDYARFVPALPRVPIAAPATGAPKWMAEMGTFLNAAPRLGLVTVHRYPLQRCFIEPGAPHAGTIGHLLAAAAWRGLARSVAGDVALAGARGLGLRVDELNSVACGGQSGVSDTFASALWSLEAMLEMDRAGVAGVNLHTFPGARYQLFKFGRPGGTWHATVAPEYYGLLMFARAAPPGSRLLRVGGVRPSGVHAWATRGTDGTTRVVLVNASTTGRRVAVQAPAHVRRAILSRLLAPGLSATDEVTLAGQSFAPQTTTAELDGPPILTRLRQLADDYVIDLPPASAALLTLTQWPS